MALATLLLHVVSSHLSAQVVIQVAPRAAAGLKRPAERPSRMLHVTNRRLAQRLLKARELLEQKQLQSAVRLLQSVIVHPEDVFFRESGPDGVDDPSVPFRSLKLAAAETLGRIGAEGRKAYELEYGVTARRLLEKARDVGGSELLEEVARKFFHSQAGRQAAYALGNQSLDRGQTLMAAMRYEQLRKSGASELEPLLSIRTTLAWARLGQPERAAEVLLAMPPADRSKLAARDGGLAAALSQRTKDGMVRSLARLSEKTITGDGQVVGNWLAWRGRHDRLSPAAPAVPAAVPEWSFPTFQRELDDPKRHDRIREVLGELGELESTERARDGLLLPAVDPLVVGDVAVFRSLFDIKAVHLPTGRHLWDSITVDPAFERILDGNVPSYSVGGRSMRQSLTQLFLAQRAWYDRTIGSLSTDGRFVFAVDWVGVLGLRVFSPGGFGQPDTSAPWIPRDHNRLLAFDLASEGMLVWELGGPRGERNSKIDGTFFLGPPLPLGGQLYCLGERDGEIRLLAIDPNRPGGETFSGGDVPLRPGEEGAEWSQGIAQPEFNVLTHPGRRLAGLSPSYSDGVLVCPTEAGLVVGVDVARRQLLWSYSYRPTHKRLNYSRQQAMRRVLISNRITQLSRNDGWFDPIPILADGAVILTPRDSDHLHCLDLETGRRRWSRPRGQAQFVASVHSGRVVVVERSRVQAFRLEDGQSAWSMPTAIPRPTGVGVRVGRLYHLPVESRDTSSGSAQASARRGAIITIDLETGRLLARTELADGRLVGHLADGGGRLLGLSHNELVAFESDRALQDRIAERLGRDMQDAAALALRGRRRLHRGEYEPAVADLAASFDARPDPGVRRLLVQALLDGLRFNYSRYAQQATRLENLLVSSDEQLAFRRLRAAGLSRTGRVVEAFDEYLKLRQPNGSSSGSGESTGQQADIAQRGRLEAIDEDLSVRRIRWLASRLSEVDARTGDQKKTALAARRQRLFEEAVAANGMSGTTALAEFLTLFNGHPVADRARVKLLERLSENAPVVERERLLLALRSGTDPVAAARATASLARLWSTQQKPEAIRALRNELESGRFAGVELAPGRTGKATVAAWRADPASKLRVETVPDWKSGELVAQRSVNEERRTSVNTYPIPFYGNRPLPWRGWSFRLDNRRQFVIAVDDRGRERWRLTTVGDLAVPGGEARVPYAFEGNYVRAAGHLLLVVLGNRFAVIDGLGDNRHPHVLWCRNLFEDKNGVQSRIVRLMPGAIGAGPGWFKITDSTGRPIGHVGQLGSQRLTYQVGTAIEAADPVTGQVLWRRGGVPRGCRIYGTERFVCVEPDGRNEVLVLDAADGTAVATRTLPVTGELIARIGRCVVSRRETETSQLVTGFDMVSGKTAFEVKLAGDLRPVVVGHDGVGLLEPDGRFRVIDAVKGRVRVDARLDSIFETPKSFMVLETPQRYLVMVNRPTNVRVRGTSTRAVTVHGAAWAISTSARSDGKPVARADWGPVKIEHQAIVVDQPLHLPVLAFACRVYRPVQNVLQPRPRTEYGVLVLDVRTGKIAHTETSTLPVSAMRASSDRGKQQVTLEFYRTTISLSFTD